MSKSNSESSSNSSQSSQTSKSSTDSEVDYDEEQDEIVDLWSKPTVSSQQEVKEERKSQLGKLRNMGSQIADNEKRQSMMLYVNSMSQLQSKSFLRQSVVHNQDDEDEEDEELNDNQDDLITEVEQKMIQTGMSMNKQQHENWLKQRNGEKRLISYPSNIVSLYIMVEKLEMQHRCYKLSVQVLGQLSDGGRRGKVVELAEPFDQALKGDGKKQDVHILFHVSNQMLKAYSPYYIIVLSEMFFDTESSDDVVIQVPVFIQQAKLEFTRTKMSEKKAYVQFKPKIVPVNVLVNNSMSQPLPGETYMKKKKEKLRNYLIDQHAQGSVQHITLLNMIENQFTDSEKFFLNPPKLSEQWKSYIIPWSPPDSIRKANQRSLKGFFNGKGKLKIRIDLSTFGIERDKQNKSQRKNFSSKSEADRLESILASQPRGIDYSLFYGIRLRVLDAQGQVKKCIDTLPNQPFLQDNQFPVFPELDLYGVFDQQYQAAEHTKTYRTKLVQYQGAKTTFYVVEVVSIDLNELLSGDSLQGYSLEVAIEKVQGLDKTDRLNGLQSVRKTFQYPNKGKATTVCQQKISIESIHNFLRGKKQASLKDELKLADRSDDTEFEFMYEMFFHSRKFTTDPYVSGLRDVLEGIETEETVFSLGPVKILKVDQIKYIQSRFRDMKDLRDQGKIEEAQSIEKSLVLLRQQVFTKIFEELGKGKEECQLSEMTIQVFYNMVKLCTGEPSQMQGNQFESDFNRYPDFPINFKRALPKNEKNKQNVFQKLFVELEDTLSILLEVQQEHSGFQGKNSTSLLEQKPHRGEKLVEVFKMLPTILKIMQLCLTKDSEKREKALNETILLIVGTLRKLEDFHHFHSLQCHLILNCVDFFKSLNLDDDQKLKLIRDLYLRRKKESKKVKKNRARRNYSITGQAMEKKMLNALLSLAERRGQIHHEKMSNFCGMQNVQLIDKYCTYEGIQDITLASKQKMTAKGFELVKITQIKDLYDIMKNFFDEFDKNYKKFLKNNRFYDTLWEDEEFKRLTELTKKEQLLPMLVKFFVSDNIFFPESSENRDEGKEALLNGKIFNQRKIPEVAQQLVQFNQEFPKIFYKDQLLPESRGISARLFNLRQDIMIVSQLPINLTAGSFRGRLYHIYSFFFAVLAAALEQYKKNDTKESKEKRISNTRMSLLKSDLGGKLTQLLKQPQSNNNADKTKEVISIGRKRTKSIKKPINKQKEQQDSELQEKYNKLANSQINSSDMIDHIINEKYTSKELLAKFLDDMLLLIESAIENLGYQNPEFYGIPEFNQKHKIDENDILLYSEQAVLLGFCLLKRIRELKQWKVKKEKLQTLEEAEATRINIFYKGMENEKNALDFLREFIENEREKFKSHKNTLITLEKCLSQASENDVEAWCVLRLHFSNKNKKKQVQDYLEYYVDSYHGQDLPLEKRIVQIQKPFDANKNLIYGKVSHFQEIFKGSILDIPIKIKEIADFPNLPLVEPLNQPSIILNYVTGLFYIIETKIKTNAQIMKIENKRISSHYNVLKSCIIMLVTEFGFTSIFFDKTFGKLVKPPNNIKSSPDIVKKRDKISIEKLAQIVYTGDMNELFLNVPIQFIALLHVRNYALRQSLDLDASTHLIYRFFQYFLIDECATKDKKQIEVTQENLKQVQTFIQNFQTFTVSEDDKFNNFNKVIREKLLIMSLQTKDKTLSFDFLRQIKQAYFEIQPIAGLDFMKVNLLNAMIELQKELNFEPERALTMYELHKLQNHNHFETDLAQQESSGNWESVTSVDEQKKLENHPTIYTSLFQDKIEIQQTFWWNKKLTDVQDNLEAQKQLLQKMIEKIQTPEAEVQYFLAKERDSNKKVIKINTDELGIETNCVTECEVFLLTDIEQFNELEKRELFRDFPTLRKQFEMQTAQDKNKNQAFTNLKIFQTACLFYSKKQDGKIYQIYKLPECVPNKACSQYVCKEWTMPLVKWFSKR